MPYGRSDAIERIVRGGSPEIRSLNGTDRMERYGAYLSSIIERDVAPVAEVRRPDTLRRLVNQLAFRTAEELNIAGLGNVLGARRATVTSYLDILSRLGIVHRLAAWTSSGSRRDVKAPKIHFMNMGCATAVRGEDSNSFGLGDYALCKHGAHYRNVVLGPQRSGATRLFAFGRRRSGGGVLLGAMLGDLGQLGSKSCLIFIGTKAACGCGESVVLGARV